MIPAFDGEELVALEALPDDADAAGALATISEIHESAVAAVMVSGPTLRRPPTLDRPGRPASGPVTAGGRRDRG